MKNLIQLVKSLKKSEVSFIQHYYKNDTNKKRLKLFNWVLNGKVQTDEDAAQKLYGGKGSAYSQLKGRLLNDLMNLLLFEEGIRQSETETFQNEVEVLRLILQGKILYNRKVHDLGIKCWENAIDKAEDFEFFTEKILSKNLLSLSMGIRHGFDAYEKIARDIDDDIDLQKKIILAEKLYYSVALPNNFLKNNQKEFARLANAGMVKLKSIYEETKSAKIGYYFYLTGINYYSIVKDFISFYNAASDFLELIKSNKAINSKARMVNAYMQVYAASMALEKYEEAYTQATKALKFTNKKGPNELTVIEYQFLSLVRLNKDKELLKVLENGLNHPRINFSSFSAGKWIFYNAVYLFLIKKYTDALVELQKDNALLKDKSGWLFGHKLLEIMSFIELEEFDMIDFRIESLRKLLQQQKHKNITRIKTIFSILNRLVKTGYHFKKTYELEETNFLLLSTAKDDFYWDPLGYEIIRFDSWFKQKI